MKPSKVLQIAWQGLARNKLRSLLTMLGVIIGVSAVIIMISVSTGTEATIEEQITELGTNLVFVQASFKRTRPWAEILDQDWYMMMHSPSPRKSTA